MFLKLPAHPKNYNRSVILVRLNAVWQHDSPCVSGLVIHAAVGGHELLLMWPYMYCAICSLQLCTVINVHTVHSVLLLM